MLSSKESILPKFGCFQDCTGTELLPFAASCPVYEEVSLEEVIEFAEKGIDKFAGEIYFSEVKILSLREVTVECSKEVSILEKFVELVRQISKSLFLTLIGGTEPEKAPLGFSLSRELSFAEFSECGVSFQKSLSRQLISNEDE